MISNKETLQQLWAKQQINSCDVDYKFWNRKREYIHEFSRMNPGCIFTVDVYKERYDFASDNFSHILGYNPSWIKTIRNQGDFLEERIHPDDRVQIHDYQIEHGEFIYSLPPEKRNDYQQIFQIRILNAKQQYVNVISRHQVLEKDKNGKAWIIMGIMDISPDQLLSEKIKRTVIDLKTGEIVCYPLIIKDTHLSIREKEILLLIQQGLMSKEIADRLNLSIYTVNNHRKNILSKLKVDNAIEAINIARRSGLID